jgi:RNA polymerase sigma factor (sigma-70 family)
VDVDDMIESRVRVGVGSVAGLYERHRTALVRFATALVGPDDAADAVSDAIESLLRSEKLAGAVRPESLMYRAVLAKARSMQRSLFARRAREQRFAKRWVTEQPEARPEVVAALVGLSPQQRACVYLTYWEDMTPSMVAEHLAVGEGSVRRQLARARARLREVLDE